LFRLLPPSEDEVRQFISKHQQSSLSYLEVGATARELPRHYTVDRNRIQLGRGEATWQRAVAAIRGWQMFNIPWVRLHWPDAAIQVGVVVAVSIQHYGFNSLNACRIVYVVDESERGPLSRYGFACGTLEEHSERGEERFTVEWNRTSDEVWYEILAFSRPNKLLVVLAYPLCRLLQRKFADVSKLAMLQAVTRP
jgi:uncharacterized protein (UPF0548 family)